MPARAPARRRPAAVARNPGILVHRLLWSMSHERAVRVTLKSGAGTKVGRVVRTWTDPRRATKNASAQNSTVVVVFEDGVEYAVNSIERVQLPLGDSGAAFGEGS
jgi:hypothetical protein